MTKFISLRGYLSGTVIARLMDDFALAAKDPRAEVVLVFNTPGGNLWGALDFADLIEASPGKSLAVVETRANSAAVPILLACRERFMAKQAHILLHAVTAKAERSDGSTAPNESDPIVRAKKIELESRLAAYLGSRTHLPPQEIADCLGGKDRLFDATQALYSGLVTQIIADDASDVSFSSLPGMT